MENEDYSPEQQRAVKHVSEITRQLIELEKLQIRAHEPIYNVDQALDQAVADMCLDNLPSYDVLEQRLRTAVTRARRLGLEKDTFIEKIGSLAFS